MNRRGPRTEAWGTPEEREEEWGLQFLSWTKLVRPDRFKPVQRCVRYSKRG